MTISCHISFFYNINHKTVHKFEPRRDWNGRRKNDVRLSRMFDVDIARSFFIFTGGCSEQGSEEFLS